MPKVVQKFRGATVKLNTEQCKLFQEEVRYRITERDDYGPRKH
jgi:hypothetical protein